jgi:MFS-type transporter involved in bile tolerance (Atg22 family)
MSLLVEKEHLGYGFSFYTIFERFAAVLWPLTWWGIIAWLGTGASSYRIAMGTMTIFVLIWLLVMVCWKRKIALHNQTIK